MLDKGGCPGKSAVTPFCAGRFYAPSGDSVGAAAVIENVDGVPMAVMARFQKPSASVSVLTCNWFVVLQSIFLG